MKKIIKFLVFWYNTALNYISYYQCKAKADKLHKLTGKRYHVVPASKKRLMVVDNNFVNIYNRKASKIRGAKKITFTDLIKMSYYSTSVQGITRN